METGICRIFSSLKFFLKIRICNTISKILNTIVKFPTVYEKQTDDSLPSLTSQDIEHLQEGGYPDTSDSPEAPNTESGSASVPSEDAKDTKKEVQP